MKAIVLTYDKYQKISEHMLFCYSKLWPNNPFIFCIPTQNLNEIEYRKHQNRIKLLRVPADIKSTVKIQLMNINDEEIVYWCMDDRYPIELDINKISKLQDWFLKNSEYIDGISFTLSSKDYSVKYSHIFTNKIIGPNGYKLFKKKHYGSIWSHQFIKAKVLRTFFENMPSNIKKAKDMDNYLLKESVLPKEFNLYVTSKSLGLFGESMSRGMITKNCLKSIKDHKLELNESFDITTEKIINNIDDVVYSKFLWRLKDLAKNYIYIFN